ncbi:MAG TPA: DUF4112 domain-containing protein [Vicinamibacterales bacterium]|nr:DUF4112 domain-containing protein [Vicinamibacterales bacterium]
MPGPDLDLLRRWAILLDSAFRVPGTRIRFGLDALIGLIPGLGDLVAPVFTVMVLLTALRVRVPKIVLARMVVNAAFDAVLGVVPLAGDIADVFWKADLRNVALLERHAQRGVPPSRGDYVFVGASLAVVALAALLPFVVLFWLLSRVPWF